MRGWRHVGSQSRMKQTGYLRTGCKPDGRRYGEDRPRTEIVDFYQNAV
jgi:hypothetical protein